VLLEGINDICFAGAKTDGQYLADPAETRSAQDIINAYRQLISRAHLRGIKVIGATITRLAMNLGATDKISAPQYLRRF
jgi:hypothetical protein